MTIHINSMPALWLCISISTSSKCDKSDSLFIVDDYSFMFFLIILSCDFHFSDSVVQLTVGQVHAYVYYLLTMKLNNSLRFSTKRS